MKRKSARQLNLYSKSDYDYFQETENIITSAADVKNQESVLANILTDNVEKVIDFLNKLTCKLKHSLNERV